MKRKYPKILFYVFKNCLIIITDCSQIRAIDCRCLTGSLGALMVSGSSGRAEEGEAEERWISGHSSLFSRWDQVLDKNNLGRTSESSVHHGGKGKGGSTLSTHEAGGRDPEDRTRSALNDHSLPRAAPPGPAHVWQEPQHQSIIALGLCGNFRKKWLRKP